VDTSEDKNPAKQRRIMKAVQRGGIVNLLRNPMYLEGNTILAEPSVFYKYLVKKRNIVLGIETESDVSPHEAASFVVGLYRLRINLFALQENAEGVYDDIEEYNSWAGVLETAGQFEEWLNLLSVTEEDISEMHKVLEEVLETEKKTYVFDWIGIRRMAAFDGHLRHLTEDYGPNPYEDGR
jgi:hypothetical protein